MELVLQHEVMLNTCGHFSSCDCDARAYPVTVHGEVIETAGKLEPEIVEVEGLPGDMALSDLDPRERELILDNLCGEAERRIARRKRLGVELKKVATLLSHMQGSAKVTGHEAAHQRIGALEYTIELVRERIEELADSVQEAA